ncbi:MAG TPA: class I SAM-dependent methyltransferase [Anaerolineales bacterium]|nr:class I SAM-dependent methyltransferase [Anaerolineales bacterium]
MVESKFIFACPRCATALSSDIECTHCGGVFEIVDGIYRFILPERCAEIHPFLSQYRLVRERDGYRLYTADEYRGLPNIKADNPQAQVWRVRQESYYRLITLLPRKSLSILDLGAGNGWLSHCLAKLGHHLVAVDWLDDEHDGLGAYRHYPVQYTSVQADFDALPFMADQFDAVIFNASLHYSNNVERTLRHACRMLNHNGRIYVMDSPTFSSNASGNIMIEEQMDYLRKNYGLGEVTQSGVGYLTMKSMMELGNTLGMAFRIYRSRGALLWALKRWWGGVKSGREPAAFGVWEGKRF